MSTTKQEYEQALACFGGAVEQMGFDINCARQGIESAARSIIYCAATLADMATKGDAHPDELAHYASVLVSDAVQLSALAHRAKGIASAQARLNG